MTIKTIALPPHRSRLLIYLLCLLVSLPTGAAFGQGKSINRCPAPASGEASDELESLKEQAAAAEDSSLPIVFVPGTAASELRLTSGEEKKKYSDDLYWLGLSTLMDKGIMAGQLGKDGNDIPGNIVYAPNPLTAFSVSVSGTARRMLKDILGYAPSSFDIDVYADFLSWAYRNFGEKRFVVAAYDWRKGARASYASIEKAVNEATEGMKEKKVILLAHSLGGLVSRDYIVQSKGEKVAALIAVGTPWLGTPKAARALLWGYNFDIGLVTGPGRNKKIKDLPKEFVTDVCKDSKCRSLKRTSFFKMEDVRELAKNFPGVYLQLPTGDFMEKYGSYYGPGPRSVIWGINSWDKMEEFYRSRNALLYDEAKNWREKNLKGGDHGVRHYLIGGVYNPKCKDEAYSDADPNCAIGNRMDMQMPRESQVPRASMLRKIGLFFWDIFASLIKSGAHNDRFLALDSAYEWGDGTTPLLSATAGEYIRGGEHPCRLGVPKEEGKWETKPCYGGKARDYFGQKTKVEAVELGSRYGHSAMLSDPQIRKRILEIHRDESGKLGPVTDKAGEDIHSISIAIDTEFSQDKNEMVTNFKIGGREVELLEPQRTHLLRGVGTTIPFKNPKIRDPKLLAPRKRDKDGNFYLDCLYRTLRMTDVKEISISLMRQNQSSKPLEVKGVTLLINNKPYGKSQHGITLSRAKEKEEIPIIPVP